MRSAQVIEDPVETLLADDVPDTDDLGVVGGNAHGQIALRDFEDEVLLLLALDHAGLNCFDERGTVVRVDDGLSDLENHVSSAPFAAASLSRQATPLDHLTICNRRSEGGQGLTKLPCACNRRTRGGVFQSNLDNHSGRLTTWSDVDRKTESRPSGRPRK